MPHMHTCTHADEATPITALLRRLRDLVAFDDAPLAAACMMLPWLGDVASEALLATLLPQDPLGFVRSACARSLGLPAHAQLDLQPPGMHDCELLQACPCGHSLPGERGLASSADHSSAASSGYRAHLPLGVAWAGDSQSYVAARHRAAGGGHRGHKRARSPRQADLSSDCAPQPLVDTDAHGGQGDEEDDRPPKLAAAGSTWAQGLEAAARKLAAAAIADPGMHDRYAWWRTAADTLAAFYVQDAAGGGVGGSEVPCEPPRAHDCDMEGEGGDAGCDGPRPSAHKHTLPGASASLHSQQSICLLLQRALLVAMVRVAQTRMHACIHTCNS
jgi:hypothetical protein